MTFCKSCIPVLYTPPVFEDEPEDDYFCAKCAAHADQLARVEEAQSHMRIEAQMQVLRLQRALQQIFDIANECSHDTYDMCRALGRIKGLAEFEGSWTKVVLP